MHITHAAEPPRVARIGFWMATALVVGNMIGSGIFLLPSALAPFGADNLPGWVLTALGAVTLALIFAQLSRAVSGAGGPYAYTREAFGDLAGFTVGWAYWVSVWVGNAAIATGAVGYLGSFFPWMIRSPLNTALTTLGFVWAFTLVNCAGIRAAGWVQGVTTVLKLLPLVAAIALLLSRLGEVNWQGAAVAPYTLGGTVSVVTLTLWAMLGLESATIPADKVEGASKTVFRATMWGTVLTVLFSAAACSAVLLLLPAGRIVASSAPFADLATSAWGAGAAQAVSLFAAISALGALNGWTLLQGELPRAMAQDGLFPRSFAKTTANGAPVVALLATSGVVTALVLFTISRTLVGVFTFFVLLATTATLVAYLACALALLRLRARGRTGSGQLGLTALGGLACLGAIYSIGALIGAGREAVLWGAVLLAAGLPVYVLLKRSAG
ncbi:MAG: amino acid permease [Acidobacteria bacterium]|nr:amino acid permease [Acidobacteriota bacterium]